MQYYDLVKKLIDVHLQHFGVFLGDSMQNTVFDLLFCELRGKIIFSAN